MTRKESYEQQTEELLQPIIAKNGVRIYDVEFIKEAGDWYLRVFIDKEEGVSIIDCENVSRELSAALDATDYIEESYILEVSSPGLGRSLKKDRHLQQSIGKSVDIKTYQSMNGKKEFTGILQNFDKEHIVILSDTEEVSFLRTDIALIKLTLDL